MSTFEPVGIVTLLTDFGLSDTYVGQMKGVLLGLGPSLRIVDLTHDLSPQNVAEGAFHLAAAVAAFPRGTVHLAVVDPGVGTARRAVVVRAPGGLFVAPDNGLLTLVLPDAIDAYEISEAVLDGSKPSSTFHGRDIFAPVSGRLASGLLAVEDVGPPLALESLVRLPFDVTRANGKIVGSIVSIDRFGNCITLIRADDLSGSSESIDVCCGDFRVSGLARTYGSVGAGEPLALVGSYGTLELSVRNGDAARTFGLVCGDQVTVSIPDSPPDPSKVRPGSIMFG